MSKQNEQLFCKIFCVFYHCHNGVITSNLSLSQVEGILLWFFHIIINVLIPAIHLEANDILTISEVALEKFHRDIPIFFYFNRGFYKHKI